MKTSDLEGPALDWWVAKATGKLHELFEMSEADMPLSTWIEGGGSEIFSPSTWWSDGGPIIEREQIELSCRARGTRQFLHEWQAMSTGPFSFGLTPLIAAMRCYVSSKFDNEVPDEAESTSPAFAGPVMPCSGLDTQAT